jgi:hypothetical protein
MSQLARAAFYLVLFTAGLNLRCAAHGECLSHCFEDQEPASHEITAVSGPFNFHSPCALIHFGPSNFAIIPSAPCGGSRQASALIKSFGSLFRTRLYITTPTGVSPPQIRFI